MIWALVACHPPPRAPGRPLGPPDTAPVDTAAPTGADSAEDTGSDCVPRPERPADGRDQACNGWSDELGVGEPAADAATTVILGPSGGVLGQSVDVSSDRYGVPWLSIGGRGISMGEVVPPDGLLELDVKGNDDQYGVNVAVTRWEAPFVGTSPDQVHVFLTAGELDAGTAPNEDDYVNLQGVVSSGFRMYDVDGDGLEEMLTSGDSSIHAFPPPTADGFPPERFLITSTNPPSHNFAYTLGDIGDLTGDGVAELTAYQEDDNVGGRAYILPSDLTGEVVNTDVGWSLAGWEYGTAAGLDIALGDVNGDGYLDLLTGATLAEDRGGVSYVVAGPILTDGWLTDGFVRFDPLYPHDQCSWAVEVLPDQDGDGLDEVAIACPNETDLPGRVEIYSGAIASGTLDAHSASRVLVGPGGYEGTGTDSFGFVVYAEGDATGDGVPDLLVGAPLDPTGGVGGYYQYPNGALYVFAAPVL